MLILLIVLCSGCFVIFTSAEEFYEGSCEISGEALGIKDFQESEILLDSYKKINFKSFAGDVASVNFGEQLSGNAAAVYDVVKELKADSNNLQIVLKNQVVFYTQGVKPTDEELAGALKEIKVFTQMAIDAYNRDYPENYWLDIEKSSFNFKYYGSSAGNRYVWTISTITYKPVISSDYKDSITGHESRFYKALDSFIVIGDTTYEKVKSIYTQLCNLITYRSQKYGHEAYGALVTKRAVCSGYAKAFKLICDREEIPCILVTGTSVNASNERDEHMWNLVKMDDGKWYCVDVTWGDSDDVIYEYLLAGTKTVIKSLGNKTFGESHIPTGDFSDTGYFYFKYPSISLKAYDPDKIIPTPVPVENPEIGDANRDGKINAEDALLVLRVAAKQIDTTAEIMVYGDMSGNCILNAEDALLILKHSAKIS